MTVVRANTDGKRILVKFDYDRALVGKIHEVPGATWHKETTTWRAPLTMDTCRMLRRVFGNQLIVREELAEWARAEIKRAESLEEFREGTAIADLSRVAEEAPAMFAAMHKMPFQLSGVSFGVNARQYTLGDEPGLGKTLQTLATLIQSNVKNILVACRRTACHTVWELETMRWAPTIDPCVAQGPRAFRQEMMDYFPNSPSPRRMLIINIEMIRAQRIVICPKGLGDKCPAWKVGECQHKYEATYDWPFLFQQDWDAIVMDESHNVLASQYNYQSKHITQWRYGAVLLRRRLNDGGLAIALSGTPFRSNLTRAWGTLNWERPDVFPSFWNWAGAHFEVTKEVHRGVEHNVIAGGAKVPQPIDEAAWDAMLRPYYLRRTKAEVVKDLPPIQYAGTPIDHDDPESPCYVQLSMEDESGPTKQANAYLDMVEEAEAGIEGGRITAAGVLAEITRRRQLANAYGHLDSRNEMSPALPSNKMEWILDFMEERRGTGRKVVIASSFSEMVEFVAANLRKEKFEVLTLTGSTSDRKRSDLVARFQDFNDPLQVVCINRKAGGESITLDAADEMVVIDQPWISDEDDQLEPRIHRVSRIHQVTVYRLVSVGTIDMLMAGLTGEQREALRTASPKKLSEMIKGYADGH